VLRFSWPTFDFADHGLRHGGKLPFDSASTIWLVICERISFGLCIVVSFGW
jgi:hypothetical protein